MQAKSVGGDLSDVISFHGYGVCPKKVAEIDFLRRFIRLLFLIKVVAPY